MGRIPDPSELSEGCGHARLKYHYYTGDAEVYQVTNANFLAYLFKSGSF